MKVNFGFISAMQTLYHDSSKDDLPGAASKELSMWKYFESECKSGLESRNKEIMQIAKKLDPQVKAMIKTVNQLHKASQDAYEKKDHEALANLQSDWSNYIRQSQSKKLTFGREFNDMINSMMAKKNFNLRHSMIESRIGEAHMGKYNFSDGESKVTAAANLMSMIDPAKVTDEEDVAKISEATGVSEEVIEKLVDLAEEAEAKAIVHGNDVAEQHFSRRTARLARAYGHTVNFSDEKSEEECESCAADIIPMLSDDAVANVPTEDLVETITEATDAPEESVEAMVELAQHNFARMNYGLKSGVKKLGESLAEKGWNIGSKASAKITGSSGVKKALGKGMLLAGYGIGNAGEIIAKHPTAFILSTAGIAAAGAGAIGVRKAIKIAHDKAFWGACTESEQERLEALDEHIGELTIAIKNAVPGDVQTGLIKDLARNIDSYNTMVVKVCERAELNPKKYLADTKFLEKVIKDADKESDKERNFSMRKNQYDLYDYNFSDEEDMIEDGVAEDEMDEFESEDEELEPHDFSSDYDYEDFCGRNYSRRNYGLIWAEGEDNPITKLDRWLGKFLDRFGRAMGSLKDTPDAKAAENLYKAYHALIAKNWLMLRFKDRELRRKKIAKILSEGNKLLAKNGKNTLDINPVYDNSVYDEDKNFSREDYANIGGAFKKVGSDIADVAKKGAGKATDKVVKVGEKVGQFGDKLGKAKKLQNLVWSASQILVNHPGKIVIAASAATVGALAGGAVLVTSKIKSAKANKAFMEACSEAEMAKLEKLAIEMKDIATQAKGTEEGDNLTALTKKLASKTDQYNNIVAAVCERAGLDPKKFAADTKFMDKIVKAGAKEAAKNFARYRMFADEDEAAEVEAEATEEVVDEAGDSDDGDKVYGEPAEVESYTQEECEDCDPEDMDDASEAGNAMVMQNELATVQGLEKVPSGGEHNFSRSLHRRMAAGGKHAVLKELLGKKYIA